MSARHVAGLILLLCAGCATVGVAGGRKQLGGELSEPVGFIILQGSSPPGQAQRLEEALGRELQRRGIAARFEVIHGDRKRFEMLWEGQLHEDDGFPAFAMPEVAAHLVQKLVDDRVLRGTPSAGAPTH